MSRNRTFGVGTWRANAHLHLRSRSIAERIENLLELLAAVHRCVPVGEIVAAHDGESASPSAAVGFCPMVLSLPELGPQLSQNSALRLDDTQNAREIAGGVSG
jgi:hypothetical protein